MQAAFLHPFCWIFLLQCFLDCNCNRNGHTNHGVVTCADQSHHLYVSRDGGACELYEEELPTEEVEEQPVYEGEDPDDVAAYATYDEEPLEVDALTDEPMTAETAEDAAEEASEETVEEEPTEEDLIYLEPDATGYDAPKPAGYGESDHI